MFRNYIILAVRNLMKHKIFSFINIFGLSLVFTSFLIASPVAWYFTQNWLENFAYRMNVDLWIFLIAGLGAVAIAFITVSFHAVKAATENPVKI